jgi:hypothetical protein
MPHVPQFDPDQIEAIQKYDRKAASRSTVGTWVVGIGIAAAALVWVTLVVTRSHHTSVARPDAFMMTAAPRSASPAR